MATRESRTANPCLVSEPMSIAGGLPRAVDRAEARDARRCRSSRSRWTVARPELRPPRSRAFDSGSKNGHHPVVAQTLLITSRRRRRPCARSRLRLGEEMDRRTLGSTGSSCILARIRRTRNRAAADRRSLGILLAAVPTPYRVLLEHNAGQAPISDIDSKPGRDPRTPRRFTADRTAWTLVIC